VAHLAERLTTLPEKPTELKEQGQYTLRAYYGKLETSFLRYTQVVAHPEILTVVWTKIPVADVETLALMKAAAVHDRGTKRDFVDIHAISKMPGWSLTRFIGLATRDRVDPGKKGTSNEASRSGSAVGAAGWIASGANRGALAASAGR
jgi:hypothetical protein